MTTWTIDSVAALTKSPTLLNALHACRTDHPLNRHTFNPWLNAWCIAYQLYEIPADAMAWLESHIEGRRDRNGA